MERALIPEWTFADFRLVANRALFDGDGNEVALSRKPIEVLHYLLTQRDRVVDRGELFESIWSGVAVSDAALSSVLRDLRRALHDPASEGKIIATRRGRGLRFVANVTEVDPLAAVETDTIWKDAEVQLTRSLRALEMVEANRGQSAREAEREHADLLVALSRVRWAGGATKAARDVSLEAARLGERMGDSRILARAALAFAGRTDINAAASADAIRWLSRALDEFPTEDSALQSEVLARLATELGLESDFHRAEALAREAVAVAERADEPGAIAYALTARHFVLQRPDGSLADRLATSRRAAHIMGDSGPSDVLALALQQQLIDFLEGADREAFDETLDLYRSVVSQLNQPFFDWMAAVLSGIPALLDGRLDEAGSLCATALELGVRAGSPNAALVFAGQLFAIRRSQGRLSELLPALEQVGEEHSGRPIIRAARAAVIAETGTKEQTAQAVREFTGPALDELPRNHDWLSIVGFLIPAVVRSGTDVDRRIAEGWLEPIQDRLFVLAHGVTTLGPVRQALGLLRQARGDASGAKRDFEAVEQTIKRLRRQCGGPPDDAEG